MRTKEKIVIAMSGGVDSSTAAAALKQRGHDVIGIGLRLPGLGVSGMDDARRVASRMGIPFHVLNCEKIFEESVIGHFCRSYLSGNTPNPCVECNRAVKFGALLDFAATIGADRVATGHYARVRPDPKTGRYLLMKGIDEEKDQSYFLYSLSQNQLSRAVFPLGKMTKEETRRVAKSLDLEVAERPASQDICFIKDGDYRKFIAERYPQSLRPGPIVDSDGNVLGQHEGIIRYTVGQRRGVGVAAGVPLYVLSVDADSATVVVGRREEMLTDRISVTRTNWIAYDGPAEPLNLGVRVRYRQTEIPAAVSSAGNGRAEVVFSGARTVAAPGQSAVFYDGDIVAGGGIIE